MCFEYTKLCNFFEIFLAFDENFVPWLYKSVYILWKFVHLGV